jgi:hypothetical protein
MHTFLCDMNALCCLLRELYALFFIVFYALGMLFVVLKCVICLTSVGTSVHYLRQENVISA